MPFRIVHEGDPEARGARRALAEIAQRHLVKYEWRGTLCRNGTLDCRRAGNRRWDDERGYAPYPPGRRRR